MTLKKGGSAMFVFLGGAVLEITGIGGSFLLFFLVMIGIVAIAHMAMITKKSEGFRLFTSAVAMILVTLFCIRIGWVAGCTISSVIFYGLEWNWLGGVVFHLVISAIVMAVGFLPGMKYSSRRKKLPVSPV